jgi:hypothetical protein
VTNWVHSEANTTSVRCQLQSRNHGDSINQLESMFRLLSSSVNRSVSLFRPHFSRSQSINQSSINQSTKRKKNAGVKCTRPNGLLSHCEPTEQRNSLATVRDYLFICLHVDRVNFWLPTRVLFRSLSYGLLQAITVVF